MNYVQSGNRTHAFEFGGNTPSARIERKLREEVLPHFFEPASRQRRIESLAPSALSIESEMELESPSFAPVALVELQARGFVRLNRWAKSGA